MIPCFCFVKENLLLPGSLSGRPPDVAVGWLLFGVTQPLPFLFVRGPFFLFLKQLRFSSSPPLVSSLAQSSIPVCVVPLDLPQTLVCSPFSAVARSALPLAVCFFGRL